jgi:hypothetical protein
MAGEAERSVENGERPDPRDSPPVSFWLTAKAWWGDAVRDAGSVRRNWAMLLGVTLAFVLCIWSVGGAVALIVGSVHVAALASAGVGVASALTAVGVRMHRRRPRG